MQNYGQPPGYHRPGSAASFAGQQQAVPLPPAYGGYPSSTPQNQSQWAAPAQNQAPNQQWGQAQPPAAGYNPGAYGAMPGGQQQPVHSYPPQQHDQPPPPPPKPYGFAAAVQQQQQQTHPGWPQQSQQNTSYTPQQQGGYPVQAGAQSQPQLYNHAAPPPPSATPGGSYFPPPAQGGRPGSIYGANQVGSFSNIPQQGPPQPSTVMSPNEQQPAYIPPSLTGQGVQAYMPSNTNPMPGVYVPPPPDVPAWQQAQHAPLQGGGKKFRYTKPTVDPSFYAQGYQGVQHQQPPLPPQPYEHSPMGAPHPQQPPGPPPPLDHYISPGQAPSQTPASFAPQQQPQVPFGQNLPYGQNVPQPEQFPNLQNQLVQPPGQYPQPHAPPPPTMASNISKPINEWEVAPRPDGHGHGTSNVSKPVNQWEIPAPAPTPAPAGQTWAQYQEDSRVQNMHVPIGTSQPQWQQGHQANESQNSIPAQQYAPVLGHDIQAPKPLARTDTASSDFFAQPSPQSQPVSPVNNRQSVSFNPGHQAGLGRPGSVSSIALANMHAQREGNRTSSPRPPPPKLPTPPPPRDDKSKFSALASGGPSDWEHFGADAEIDDEEIYAKKPGPVELDGGEVPSTESEPLSGPSPPSTHGWPSPATQPAHATAGERKDTYQPTPPPVVATLADRTAPQASHQSFTMGDAAPAPLSISPKPLRNSRPPSTQQAFVVSDSSWQPPAQQQQQQQQQQLPSVKTSFVVGDEGWGAAQKTPTQESNAHASRLVEEHAAAIRANNEEFDRLRADAEREKTNLLAEIEKLQGVVNTTKALASNAEEALEKQIHTLKIDAAQARTNVDATKKEKDLTIERMKEDAEGKEHNIEERDAIIADLRHQLEAEKTKELVKATLTPSDLIPDLDPWYAGSLGRYIAMLRAEAGEAQVEDKIKTFKAFVEAESGVRGIQLHETPPPTSAHESTVPVPESKALNTSKPALSRDDLNVQVPAPSHDSDSEEDFDYSPGGRPVLKQKAAIPPATERPLPQASGLSKPALSRGDLNVQVPTAPPDSPDEEDYDYSPGGRPVLKRKATIPKNENAPIANPFSSSTQSTTILTPTSSVDDDSNKTPVQSPPEEQTQSLYKAYVPPALFSNPSTQSVHRQSVSDVPASTPLASGRTSTFQPRPVARTSTSEHHDEIFFGAHGPEASKGPSRPTSSDSAATPDVPIPAPLAFGSHRPVSIAPSSRKDPSETLADLLPTQIVPDTSNRLIEEFRTKLTHLKQDITDPDDLTKRWEATATATRKKNETARRKRQEEQEEANEDAFNNDEISYADLNALEQEIKQKENDLKTSEDRAEYASYVSAVFDPVYDTLQTSIKALMDLYISAENLVHTSSVSGIRALEPDALSTLSSLQVLGDVHSAILERQDDVVRAVAERDKRYKKTEIQPLYARGDIAKMKAVEKHFDTAEKQARIRALREKAGRVGELVSVVEDVVVKAVGAEQADIEGVVNALRNLEDGEGDTEMLEKAKETLGHLKASSVSILSLFNALEIRHNATVMDAEIAQALFEGKDVGKIEEEKEKGEEKFIKEFERRVQVIESDGDEIEMLVKRKGKVGSEEEEKEKRLKMALEEAKRRNGDA